MLVQSMDFALPVIVICATLLVAQRAHYHYQVDRAVLARTLLRMDALEQSNTDLAERFTRGTDSLVDLIDGEAKHIAEIDRKVSSQESLLQMTRRDSNQQLKALNRRVSALLVRVERAASALAQETERRLAALEARDAS